VLASPDRLTPHSDPIPDRPNNFWYVRRNPDTVIVFLHGIFSDSRSCWLCEDGARVFWPDLIRDDSRFGDASIFMAGYYTAIDAGDFSVRDCAREVLDALQRVDTDGTPPVMSAHTVQFVCHSTGGIVARYMIERNLDDFREKILGLALIASPSLGSVWASLVGPAARYYNQRLGQQLRWGGEALDEIHGRFKDLVNERATRLPGLFGMEACENKMVMRNWLPAWLRAIVPPRLTVVNKRSAGQYFGDVAVLRGTDHFSTVKPDGMNHPSHQFLVSFEQEFQQFAATLENRGMSRQELAVEQSPVVDEDLDAGEWPVAAAQHAALFVGVTVPAIATPGVAVCVVLEDPGALNVSLRRAVDDWKRDPYLRDLPGLAEVSRPGHVDASGLDTELRAKLTEWLAAQLFEAYACFRRTPPVSDTLDPMLAPLLLDRLLANRAHRVQVNVDHTLTDQLAEVRRLSVAAQARATSAAGGTVGPDVVVQKADRAAAGALVSGLLAEAIRDRLRSPTSAEARAFGRIYPQKLRVLHDIDTGIRYQRRRPFDG
jgi:hypothetical protein